MIGCLLSCARKQPIIVFYFEFETVLKFDNLGAWTHPLATFDNLINLEKRPKFEKYMNTFLNSNDNVYQINAANLKLIPQK